MTPLQFRNLLLSACTHWEISLWFASAASWHGASAVTCPRHHPHMSSLYEGRNIIKEIQPAYESLTGHIVRAQLLLCRISWPQPASLWFSSEHQFMTHLFACVNWRAHQVSTKLRVISINEGLPVNAMCWYLFCQVVEEQQKRHYFHTESSGDLPDLNLLRIKMECSEPRRVIMLTIQVQCLRGAKWSHSICGVHIDPPGQLWMKIKCSSLLHQVL